MTFKINSNQQNKITRLRRLGYTPYINKKGEESFVRRIQGGAFPRIHLYINKDEAGIFLCSIHIDQTAPVYSKGNAHRGDYDSPVLKKEVERIEKTNS